MARPQSTKRARSPDRAAQTPALDTIESLLARPSRLLAFRGDTECYFQDALRTQRTRHIFWSSLIGAFLYALFGVSDYVLLPDTYRTVWNFRIAIALPIFLAVCLLFSRIDHHGLREGVVGVTGMLACAVTGWLIAQSRSPFAAQELACFFLFIVYGNVIVRFRFPLALALSIVFLGIFVATCVHADHIPLPSHINNLVLLVSTTVLSLVGNYRHEMEERRNFLLAERDALRERELQEVNTVLEDLSFHDSLTATYNKRYFDQALLRLETLTRQVGMPLSVLYIDVDHFKPYNDNYGHMAGDQALVAVAELLASHFRRRDEILARTGGEEFIGLLPGMSQEQTLEIAERIRSGVEQLALSHEHSSVAPVVTVSIGIAMMPTGCRCAPHDLLDAADAALYRAKQQGRNRIVAVQMGEAGQATPLVAA